MQQASMDGKVVLVTGAGGGIGRAIALEMARQGAKVLVNDLGVTVEGEGTDTAVAQKVVDEIRDAGGVAEANGDSVSEWDSAHRMVRQAVEAWGGIDAIVNNAGILRDRMFHKMSEQEWDRVLKVHLYGAFYVSRAAATHFREQNGGSFVHMTSGAALYGNLGQANYGAAKLGIVSMSRQIALDMARYNVRSNCISPNAMSRMIESIPVTTPEQESRLRLRQQTMAPATIAPMAVFLASDLAAGISGQIYQVRGNEIFLISQPRPIRSAHCSEGWTVERIAERVAPAFRSALVPLEKSADVMNWEPL